MAEKVSQIDGRRPSAWMAPSIWYDAVATPQVKSLEAIRELAGGARRDVEAVESGAAIRAFLAGFRESGIVSTWDVDYSSVDVSRHEEEPGGWLQTRNETGAKAPDVCSGNAARGAPRTAQVAEP